MHFATRFTLFALAVSSVFIPLKSSAHERYIQPTHTVLSGELPQSVTLMASISNDMFHPDRPLGNNEKGIEVGPLKRLFSMLNTEVTGPNGKIIAHPSWQAFQRLSVVDLTLNTSGTYRVSMIQEPVRMTTFSLPDGSHARRFGPNPELPKGATHITRRSTESRVETVITANEPSRAALQVTGKGLELIGESHPNDLFAGEPAQFALRLNGKKVDPNTIELSITRGGTRHRNNREETQLTVNSDGQFTFTPSASGYYFLQATATLQVPQPADIDVKHVSLMMTFEVFPE